MSRGSGKFDSLHMAPPPKPAVQIKVKEGSRVTPGEKSHLEKAVLSRKYPARVDSLQTLPNGNGAKGGYKKRKTKANRKKRGRKSNRRR